jgi:EAL domain-containing protein (putative c-di-GMP-specific phosphodiesterase class I)
LEYLPDAGQLASYITLEPLPFRIGRSAAGDFVIPHRDVSRQHAEICHTGDHFRIRDLGSANGTFVDGRRVQEEELTDGAIVHLAHQEFRFHTNAEAARESGNLKTDYIKVELQLSVLHGRPLLEEMLDRRRVLTLFQPIVELSTGKTLGYEALGRGTHPKLSAKPSDLFRLADRCELAEQLSRLFRAVAVEEATSLPGRPALFCNLHPSELGEPQLRDSLDDLRRGLPAGQALVVEIHEDTVADLDLLRRLRRELRDLGILLAYDDFGAGRSRLAELAAVPPDFVKLDMGLVRNLQDSVPRQWLVKAITDVARKLGSRVIAEGIETTEEAEICAALGCQFGQGYLLGCPERAPGVGEDDTWKIKNMAA